MISERNKYCAIIRHLIFIMSILVPFATSYKFYDVIENLINNGQMIDGRIFEHFGILMFISTAYMFIMAPILLWFIIDHIICTKKIQSFLTIMIINVITCRTYILPLTIYMTMTSQFMIFVLTSMLQLYAIDVVIYILYIRWNVIMSIFDITLYGVRYTIRKIKNE